MTQRSIAPRGQWMALLAAILGWMFDGFEIGLFPLVVHPALKDLLQPELAGLPLASHEAFIGKWIGVMTAGFLVGAATGGVVFGWLGDRLGRVRAMTLSVLTYAVFSGLCGISQNEWQLFAFRFLASLGMGGEWSLGVSLVMELWPNKSRAWLAGLIGAAANVGFVIIALLGLVLSTSSWRVLMFCGAAPAVLTFFIRLMVPESEKWQDEDNRGATKSWASSDLLAVVVGAAGPLFMIYLWAEDHPLGLTNPLPLQILGSLIGLLACYFGYTLPIRKFLQRSAESGVHAEDAQQSRSILRRMLLGATLSGVALLGTWASAQNAPPWAGSLVKSEWIAAGKVTAEGAADSAELKQRQAEVRSHTQLASGVGAVLGTIVAALLGGWLGRRVSYFLLCVLSLGSSLLFFQANTQADLQFLVTVFLLGAITASFYGWLPLYLPELFPTRVRAFGQGFAFNFGRILAAVGSLQFGYLMKNVFDGSYPEACTILSFIYVFGMVIVWFAPETRGQELPE